MTAQPASENHLVEQIGQVVEQVAEQVEGQERRAYPRHAVDCPATVFLLGGAGQTPVRMLDLSLGGCRVETAHRFIPGLSTRVEVQFQLQGISFRIVGVTMGNRLSKSFAIRFLDMSNRRREELSGVVAEIAEKNTALAEAAKAQADIAPAASLPDSEPVPNPRPQAGPSNAHAEPASSAATPPAKAPSPAVQDRRSHGRHTVDTSAKLLLVKTNISMPGRIVNLSLGGCKIRTNERFNVGIFVRVEAEFYLHGLPFRIGGVSQAILDKNTIGVKFLDMSERKRTQLSELIAEIDEVQAYETAASNAAIAGSVAGESPAAS
jgi:predicted DNA-binding ribbon-helix-helix protein